MRFSRRKSICGSPTCTALKPNTSSTALSNCAISQPSTWRPPGVANQSDKVAGSIAYNRPMPEQNHNQVVPIPAFKDNYIWALTNGRRAAIIDPGDARPVLDYLARERLGLVPILAPHPPPDHGGGVAELPLAAGRGRDIPVYGPKNEPISTLTHPVAGGDRVAIPELGAEFDVLDIPGHTRAHIAYYGSKMVFCGDTLFACGCGRGFEGTPAQLHAALQKLAALPDTTLAYCGHEYTLANIRFPRTVEPGNVALRSEEHTDTTTREKN